MSHTTITQRNISTDEARFLLRQLNPDDRKKFLQDSVGIKSREERINMLLETRGDQVQIRPRPEEDALYDELIKMANDCRKREWGTQSQANLVKYIALLFIPEIVAFANNDK